MIEPSQLIFGKHGYISITDYLFIDLQEFLQRNPYLLYHIGTDKLPCSIFSRPGNVHI